MNALTPIEQSDLVLTHIDTLILSPMNPRQNVTKEEVGELADSLIKCGLIQNLSGFLPPGNEAIEIVAGGRRLRALRLLADQGFMPGDGCPLDLTRIPVKVTSDPEIAAQWAMGENVARKAPNVADEVQAYQALADRGIAPNDIARAFAVTEIHVKRRLKLATLPESVMEALRAEKIGYGQAAALTLCNDAEHIEQLLATTIERGLTEQAIRNEAARGAVNSTDRRAVFVDVDAYVDVGGRVVADMFTPFVVLQDEALLNDLFAARLRQEAEDFRVKGGWLWAEPVFDSYVSYDHSSKTTRLWAEQQPLSEDEAAEYDELAALAEAGDITDEQAARQEELEAKQVKDFTEAQRAVSGAFVYVDRNGEVHFDIAYVRKPDEEAAIAAGVMRPRHSSTSNAASGATVDEAPASPFSAAVITDMKAIKLAAVQSALIDSPDLLVDLLAFALSPASGAYCSVFDIRAGRPSITPSNPDAFDLDPRLDQGSALKVDPSAEFAKFRKLPKKERAAALHAAVARALNYGCNGTFNGKPEPLFDTLATEAGASIRNIWTPTKDNFFGRVTSGYLDEIYNHIFALDPASPEAKSFAGMKKVDKAVKLDWLFQGDAGAMGYKLMTNEAADRMAAWLPDCF
ncbi:MAG: ParB/RepB/Spo0J family partition protein [Desulfurellales bacterium]|nr:MAG: ParB/RepB/Spo0J family partition protein [Desulfurellales bacterium]